MRLFDMDSKEDYLLDGKYKVATPYAPLVDIIEIVRCKDCKYGEERIEDYRCWMLDEDWDIRFSPMHFCSYGRRREDGKE